MSTPRRSARSRPAPRVLDWIARAATHTHSSRSSPTRSSAPCSALQRSSSSCCSFSEAVSAAANDRIKNIATVRDDDISTDRVGDNATVRVGDNATDRVGDIATDRVGDSATVRVGDIATDRVGDSATVRVDDMDIARVTGSTSDKEVYRINENAGDIGFADSEAMPAPIQCDSPPRRDSAEGVCPGIKEGKEAAATISAGVNDAEWSRKAVGGIAMLLNPSSAEVVVDQHSHIRVPRRSGHGDSEQVMMGSSVCGLQMQRLQQKQVSSTRRSIADNVFEVSVDSEQNLDLNRMCTYVLPRPDSEEQLKSCSVSGDSVHDSGRDIAEQRFLLAQEMRRISMKRIDRENDVAAANEARRMMSVQCMFKDVSGLGPCQSPDRLAVTVDEKIAEGYEHTDAQQENKPVVQLASADVNGADAGNMVGESVHANINDVDENDSPHEEGQQRQKRAFVRKMQVLGRRRLERVRQAGAKSPVKVPKEHSRRSNRVLIKNALQFVCLAGGATDLERISCMDELQRSKAEWFIVLLRKNMLKFKALYSVDAGVIQKIFGDGPAQIDSSMVDSVYKYNSAAKCFEIVHARGITAITDAVALKPSLRRRVRTAQLN